LQASCAGLSVTCEQLNFSVDQIILAGQKIGVSAMATGLFYMLALLNRAEAQVSASTGWKLIDLRSVLVVVVVGLMEVYQSSQYR
jgi:hypothetical protein